MQGLFFDTNGIKVLYDSGINKNSGTMSLWINKKAGSGTHIIGNEDTAKQLINIYLNSENHVKVAVRNNVDVFTEIIATTEVINANEWYFIALRWKLNGNTLECTLILNNKIYAKSVTDFKDFTGGKTALGTSINGSNPLNGLIKDFSYSPLALSDKEMMAMYHQSRLNYEYDTLRRLTKKTINAGANSFETSYSYVPGNVTGATTSKLFSINNNGTPIEYQYDANGNITKIIEGGRENLYYYNELNELI